jgi:hypothetical protein
VSDERLRDLERKASATGLETDLAALLSERLRLGQITQDALKLAAYCGSEAARLTQPLPCVVDRPERKSRTKGFSIRCWESLDNEPVQRWAYNLVGFWDEHVIARVALGAALAALRPWEVKHANPDDVEDRCGYPERPCCLEPRRVLFTAYDFVMNKSPRTTDALADVVRPIGPTIAEDSFWELAAVTVHATRLPTQESPAFSIIIQESFPALIIGEAVELAKDTAVRASISSLVIQYALLQYALQERR